MPLRGFVALILSSALVTLDGTAVTVALPAIGRDLDAGFSLLQWTTNASLLSLAALVMPAGVLGDRFGRRRVMRLGLLLFAAASLACAIAPTAPALIVARLMQGAGAAAAVPGAVAILRATYADERERTRRFGTWAGWSGAASAAGPLVGGALVDIASWRAVFLLSMTLAIPTAVLLGAVPESRAEGRQQPVNLLPGVLIIVLMAGASFLLINARAADWTSPATIGAIGAVAAAVLALWWQGRRRAVIPVEIVSSRNCVAANAATFVLYFGMFGLAFLLVMYTQMALGYSATWSAMAVLPTAAVMLVGAERFGRLAARFGTRALLVAAPVAAAAGILWLGTAPHPLPFWSHLIPGTALFGLGLAIAVSPLTHAAVSSVPEACAGTASGFHHATVRTAGLVAVAILGSLAAGGADLESLTLDGFRRALVACAILVAVAGTAAGAFVTNEEPGGLEEEAA